MSYFHSFLQQISLAKFSLSNLSEEDVKWITNKENILRRIPLGAEASIVLVGQDDALEQPVLAFVRLAEAVIMPNTTEVSKDADKRKIKRHK